jgi:hypothetical protein
MLLDDIVNGLPFASVKQRFAEKMHPLRYQRPTAAPSEGNIKRAEEIVSKLESAGALARRFARLEDVQAIWMPPKPAGTQDGVASGTHEGSPSGEGVFNHLRRKSKPIETGAPPTTLTWEKFARTVLPKAEQVEIQVPAHGSFSGLVTSADPDAPPILQWDRENARNPMSWYFYVNGSPAEQWNLRGGTWATVSAITLKPSMWGDRPLDHHGKGVFILIEACRDLRYSGGAGFFPDYLRSEYHEIRKTMEAYAKAAIVAGKDEATACGIGLSAGQTWNAMLRVTSSGVVTSYKLDRWD